MLTNLVALNLCASTMLGQAQSQNPPSRPYDPRNAPAVSVALTGFNLLKQGEPEGDEPYLLVYEYGVRIPVIKGVIQRPQPLPIRIVGRGAFDNIQAGYDWAKPNNQLQLRGFATHFNREVSAHILFGLMIYLFDHDEYREDQLTAMKRVATSFVREAQEQMLKTDPNKLVDPTQLSFLRPPASFSPFTMKNINVMSSGKADNLAGQRNLLLLSKPMGSIPGLPEELTVQGSVIRPNSVKTLTIDVKPSNFGSLAQDIFRGEIRLIGQVIRHR